MSNKYYELSIGTTPDTGWSWKRDFPPVYILPFAESKPFLLDAGEDESDPAFAVSADAATALRVLSRLGLSDSYFEKTWASFRSWGRTITLGQLKIKDEVYSEAAPMVRAGEREPRLVIVRGAFRRLERCSSTDEIEAAIALVRKHGWKDWNVDLVDDREPSLLPMIDGLTEGGLGIEHVAESLALGSFLYDSRERYPEIIALFELYIILKSAHPEAEVTFTFATEHVQTEDDAMSCLLGAIDAVAEKVRLYNHTFLALTDGKGILQRRLRRDALLMAWQAAKAETSEPHEKGVRLEQFADLLLTEIEGLLVVEKNLRTQTAELDIVAQNNVSRPFWTNLGSPLIFVECKNWTDPVDVREGRALESKMRARGRIARVSIFLSISGFTKAFTDHVTSLARDDLLLVSIQGSDVDDLIGDPDLDATKWIETIIARQAAGRAPQPQRGRRPKATTTK